MEYGWGKDMLAIQIDTRRHEREGKAINNFPVALPPIDSDMAQQVFKDPYVFDFLGTADLRREAELERKLVDHIQQFLLELGQGFAFVGRQVHLEVGDSDFYIDLLFYCAKIEKGRVRVIRTRKRLVGQRAVPPSEPLSWFNCQRAMPAYDWLKRPGALSK